MSRFTCACSLFLFVWVTVPTSAEPVVIGETSTIHSEVMGEERSLMIHLPEGYAASDTSYPVLYVLGGTGNFHLATGTVAALARAGHVPEMIVVGVRNTNRIRDLTPTAGSPSPETGNISYPSAGGADKYLRFFDEELIPHVEETHRAAPFRILIGHSLGGLFALHALVASPDTFHAYIAIGPSLHWDNGELAQRAEETLAGMDELNRYLFMSIADETGMMRAGFSALHDFLTYDAPRGLVSEFRYLEGDDHGSAPIRSIDLGLRMIYPRWRMPRSIFSAPDLARIRQHHEMLSAEYGYPIPVPEHTMNHLGYLAQATGDLAVAIEFFEANVEDYPRSANVYDSLAGALERDEQYAAALANYEKAYRLARESDDPGASAYESNLERVKGKIQELAESGE